MSKTITITKCKITTKTQMDLLKERVARLEKAVFGDEKDNKKEILDKVEKEYLSAVVKPIRDKVENIKKYRYGSDDEYIVIDFIDEGCLVFPFFETGTMYKGMEEDRIYTLDELGL